MPDAEQRPTLTSIAKRVGVSPKTVSNAFNHPDQLSPALREQILKIAGEMGYLGPDPLARAFRQGRSRMIGIVYGNRLSHAFADDAFVLFLAGVSDVLEKEGLGLILIPGPVDGVIHGVGVKDTVMDGAIVYSLAVDDPAVEELRTRNTPFVTVDQPIMEGISHVGVDDRLGGRLIAEWVHQQGYERVGIISFAMHGDPHGEVMMLNDLPPATLPVTANRLKGIAQVLEADNVPVAHVYGSSERAGADGAHALLNVAPNLDVWICLGDRMAIGALDVIRQRGNSIVVTGFDGVLSDTPFTTIHQPHREKGSLAARVLLDVMCGRDGPNHVLPVSLLVP